MAKTTTGTRRSNRCLTVELTYDGRRYGHLEVDKKALEGAIVDSFNQLFGQSYDLQVALAGGAKGKVRQLNRPRVCATHVSGRIEELARDMADREVLNWIHRQGSDEDKLRELEIGLTLEYEAVRDFVDWIAKYGTPAQRRRVAQALTKHIVQVRGGPGKGIRSSDVRWVRKNIARVRAAVRAAKGGRSHDQDNEPLTRLVRELWPRRAAHPLVMKVHSARRAGDAVALIVGEKLGVGREKAQQVIKAAADSPR